MSHETRRYLSDSSELASVAIRGCRCLELVSCNVYIMIENIPLRTYLSIHAWCISCRVLACWSSPKQDRQPILQPRRPIASGKIFQIATWPGERDQLCGSTWDIRVRGMSAVLLLCQNTNVQPNSDLSSIDMICTAAYMAPAQTDV